LECPKVPEIPSTLSYKHHQIDGIGDARSSHNEVEMDDTRDWLSRPLEMIPDAFGDPAQAADGDFNRAALHPADPSSVK
jgi:hypothetical protein